MADPKNSVNALLEIDDIEDLLHGDYGPPSGSEDERASDDDDDEQNFEENHRVDGSDSPSHDEDIDDGDEGASSEEDLDVDDDDDDPTYESSSGHEESELDEKELPAPSTSTPSAPKRARVQPRKATVCKQRDANKGNRQTRAKTSMKTPRGVKKSKRPPRQWARQDLPIHITPEKDILLLGPALEAETPLDIFHTQFHQDVIEFIVVECNKFRIQLNRTRMKPVTSKEIRRFLGICIYMSVVALPFRRMYWSPATRQGFIDDAHVTCNRFEEILYVLHFCDNTLIKKKGEEGYDRLYKVRTLLYKFNETFASCTEPELQESIDEQIIPFKGQHGLNVYMKNKPYKWGYKVWVRAGTSGYVYQFQMCSDNLVTDVTHTPDDIGESGRVILRLSQGCSTRDIYIL